MNNNKKTVKEKEIETLKFWQDNNVFEESITNPAGKGSNAPSFSFYDGPPFATGLPHHGHILAGTIKDIMPRYKTMQGYTVRRVWGWDCHGLPVENLIEKELNLNSKKEIEDLGIDKFTAACEASVLRYDKEWKEIVPRLGRWVDMEHAYKTMDYTYTESVWWSWKNLYDKGLAYEGHKIMHICPRCETPLAQSEVGLEYHDVTDISVTVEFKLNNKTYNNKPLYILAWTTTPWTLPGNTALAINRNIQYVIVESKYEGEINYFVVAKNRVDSVFNKSEEYKIVEEINIEDCIGQRYEPPFKTYNNEEFLSTLKNRDNIWKVWHADFITDDSGTGIAHEAPAFGAEDMELAKANNIPIIKHVLMNGKFASEVGESVPSLKDLVVKKKDDTMSTDIEVIRYLAGAHLLFAKEKIIHSYPLCWRCKTPLLNYATSSWFVDVPAIKDRIIAENQTTKWVPEHMRDGRFGKWLEGAREWAVSRRRYWGVPLPIWKSEDEKEIKVIGSLLELADNNVDKYNNTYTLIRHGEADSNVKDYYDDSHRPENNLTETGISQANSVKNNFKDYDLIISSSLLRAIQTADIIADDKIKRVIDDRVFEAFPAGDLNKIYEVGYRAQSLIDELETQYQGKKILIVTHQATIRCLMQVNGLPRLILKNCEYVNLPSGKLPRDETGKINLHRPHIDKIKFRDSRGIIMNYIGDVFDCWYESGSMPYAQLHYPFENKDIFDRNFPADFIAEGVDQTRGWFYSLINLSTALFDKVSFKHVIVNGHVMSEDGTKMSKSLKNYTDPMELVDKFGADSLRFYLANSPAMCGEQLDFSDKGLEEVYKKNIARLENVLEFYLMYTTDDIQASYDSENVLDRWIINRLYQLINTSNKGYDNYKIDIAVSGIESFVDDLSTWYLRRSRERLKGDDNDKINALKTLKYVFTEYAKAIAPVMPFLAERLYQSINRDSKSVHLEAYPSIALVDESLINTMKELREDVAALLMLRQKNNIPVRQPLAQASLKRSYNNELTNLILDEVNVKSVIVDKDYSLDLNITEELLREGKLRELSRSIKDKRKELGLIASDYIILEIDQEYMNLINDDYKKEMKIVEIVISDNLNIKKA